MRPAFENVLIFSPSMRTGGPEALHQLAHEIARHGGEARMVYYDRPYEMAGDRIQAGDGPFPALDHYARYEPRVLREARLGPDTLLVFPEPLAKTAAAREGSCRRALWWLSLDNVLTENPEIRDEAYRKRFFADRDLVHFYQSAYAQHFLMSQQPAQYVALSDYTDPEFIASRRTDAIDRPIAERAGNICFFPTKGRELAAHFIATSEALRETAHFVPIENMTKPQVRETLSAAKIYIDFGHHPGKDRVPREAAVAGAVVLLHATGAAQYFGDHPLRPEYRFTMADVVSGALQDKVQDILADPAPHFDAQAFYRQTILLEREQFETQVKSFFFRA